MTVGDDVGDVDVDADVDADVEGKMEVKAEMDVEGDAFFPELSEKDFVLREKTDRMTNSSNEINFLYEIYDKKSIPIQVTI